MDRASFGEIRHGGLVIDIHHRTNPMRTAIHMQERRRVVDLDFEVLQFTKAFDCLALALQHHFAERREDDLLAASLQPFGYLFVVLFKKRCPLGADHLAEINGIDRCLVGDPGIEIEFLLGWPVKQDRAEG